MGQSGFLFFKSLHIEDSWFIRQQGPVTASLPVRLASFDMFVPCCRCQQIWCSSHCGCCGIWLHLVEGKLRVFISILYLLVVQYHALNDSSHASNALQGWKLPDFMFATRRSLLEACITIAKQLENFYSSIRVILLYLSSLFVFASSIYQINSHLASCFTLEAVFLTRQLLFWSQNLNFILCM